MREKRDAREVGNECSRTDGAEWAVIPYHAAAARESSQNKLLMDLIYCLVPIGCLVYEKNRVNAIFILHLLINHPEASM